MFVAVSDRQEEEVKRRLDKKYAFFERGIYIAELLAFIGEVFSGFS